MQPLSGSDPREIGGHRLLGRLGSGGMGRVYLARSPGLRRVALKVAHPHLAGSPEFRARFSREVAAAQQVGGVYTAAVTAADPEAAQPWLATEYLPGPTLHAAVAERGPLPAAELRPLAAALAEALEAIHSAGLVHRDLKPGNIILTADGPRVIDFGIALAPDATAITRPGTGLGTPAFLSPEQAEGREAAPSSDLFSLGAVLVYAATGEPPFGTEPVATVLYRVVHEQPRLEAMPAEWRDLVAACLDKNPDARPDTAQVLRAAGGAPGGWVSSGTDAGLAAFVTAREQETLAASDAAETRARRRRLRRHPATWAGAALAGAAAAVLVPATGIPVPDLGYSEANIVVDPDAPAAVLEPVTVGSLGFESFSAEGTTAISLRGSRMAHWAGPDEPLVVADLDSSGEVVAREDVPEPEVPVTGLTISDSAEQVIGLREDGGMTTWLIDHPFPDEPRHSERGQLVRYSAAVVGQGFWDRGYATTSDGDLPGANEHGSVRLDWDGGYSYRHASELNSSGIAVTALAIDPDFEYVASGGASRTVELRGATGGSHGFLQVSRDAVREAEALPTGNAPDGSEATSPEPDSEPQEIAALAVGPGGEHVAFALGNTAYVWAPDTATPAPLPRAEGDAELDSVAISPAGELVAASWQQGTVNLWHLRTGHHLAVMAKPEGPAPVAFTEDGRTLRAVTSGGELREWDLTELAG